MDCKSDGTTGKDSRSRVLRDLESILKTRLIVNVHELAERLELENYVSPDVEKASNIAPLRFPESLLNRIEKGNIHDPVLTQFLPTALELKKTSGFSNDPLCELKPTPSEKKSTKPDCIMQKYAGRALVITTNSCACECRFCFRRFFPKNRALFPLPENVLESQKGENDKANAFPYFDAIFESIRNDVAISELIFSGGDPLTLSNDSLKSLLHYIRSIDHVKRVRFHTRVPILTPQRIDEDFPSFDEFQPAHGLPPFILHVVLHVNSPNEIDDNVANTLLLLRRKGYILTSQSTLLKGINDSPSVLAQLYEKLINLGVIPYYLHKLDRVQGAAHFEVPVSQGRQIVQNLGARVPGYANPQYVREVPNRPMKTNLFIDRSVD